MGIRKVEDNTIYIEYERPSFYKRVFSTLLDFIIFALLFSALVFAADSIVKTTPNNIEIQKTYNTIKEDSKLYKYSSSSLNEMVSIVTYYNDAENIKDLSASNIKAIYSSSLDYLFTTYLPSMIEDKTLVQELATNYDNDRLEYKFNGENYFLKNEGKIVENSSIKDNDFNVNFYENYILSKATGNLLRIQKYFDANLYFSFILILIDVPIPLFLSAIIVLYIPGLIMRKTRRTIGKLAFNIGLVNAQYLQVSFARYTARFAIYFFAEIFLSIFTFGIPCIISFSMMLFTKNKQCFHDYMLKIQAVDISDALIYTDISEAAIETPTREAPDFKMRGRL